MAPTSAQVGVSGLPVLPLLQSPATAQAPGPVMMPAAGSPLGMMGPMLGRHLLQSALVSNFAILLHIRSKWFRLAQVQGLRILQ